MSQPWSHYTLAALLGFLASLALVGCQTGARATATPPAPWALVASATPVPATPSPPAPSPTALPTMGATPSPAAQPSPSPAALEEPPATLPELADWLAQAWRDERDLDDVHEALAASGYQTQPADLQAADLDGDGRAEWLVTILAPGDDGSTEPLFWGDQGLFWVVAGDGIELAIDRRSLGWESAPHLVSLADFTGDGVEDAATEAVSCGAHTCFQHYDLLTTDGDGLRNVVGSASNEAAASPTIDISYAEATTFDYDGDGVLDFVVHGGTIGSAGAGIHRAHTDVWRWDGAAMSLLASVPDPSNYRHHRLYDANAAYAAGDLATAERLYLDVIQDETLDDPPPFFDDGSPPDDSRAFAAFRLALLRLAQADRPGATTWVAWLQGEYPDKPLSTAAERLLASWDAGGSDLAAACGEVTSYLATVENPVGSIAYLGYGNPELAAGDVCPLAREAGP